MATKTDYTRKCQQLDVLIDLLERENKRLQAEKRTWIPCKERLPKGIGQAIVQTNGGAIHEAFYKGKNDYGHLVWMRLDNEIYWDDEVVAWQPLPAPYKEDAQ